MKNRAKFISLLVAVCMMITLLPAVALAAPMENISVTDVQRYENGSLKSFVLDYEAGYSYKGNTIVAATMRIGIQETPFNHPSGSGDCGDFTEEGKYAKTHDHTDWNQVTGVVWANGDGISRPATGANVDPVTISFTESTLTPVAGKTYYVYAWAKYVNPNGDVYPDAFLFSFTVDGNNNVVTSTDSGNTDPGNTGITTVDASSGIDLWYNGGNSFGSSKGDVPTSVEIDGVPVAFNGSGSQFTVGCVSPNAKWVTVKWHGTTVTTNFTPDANATCSEINIPKTGDASVMAFALMAVVAAAGALRRK